MARGRVERVARTETLELAECQDDLLGGPITLTFPGSTPADNKDEAEQKMRDWWAGKTTDEMIEATVGRNCSGMIFNPCELLHCDDGRCIFDYEIGKITVTEVKPAGKTAIAGKPTQARWSGSIEVWWGCTCEHAV